MRFGGMGGWEWIIILAIVIIIFGVGKLPQAGAAIGQSIKEFRNAVSPKPEDDEKKSDAPAAEAEDKT